MNIAAEIYARMVADMGGPVGEAEFRRCFDLAKRAEAVFLEKDAELTERERNWLRTFFLLCRSHWFAFGTWPKGAEPEWGDIPARFGPFQLAIRNREDTQTLHVEARLERFDDRSGFRIEAMYTHLSSHPQAFFMAAFDGFLAEDSKVFVTKLRETLKF